MIKKSSGSRGPAITLWIIAGLYLSMVVASLLYFVGNYSKSNPDYSISYRQVLLLPVAWTCLLVVEGVLLWKFRNTANRPQAWIHVACMFGCFILTFLFTLAANFYLARFHGGGDAVNKFQLIYKINQYSFWAFFIVGHIFFISLIVQRFTKTRKTIVDEPSSGILDEFAE